MARRIPNAPSRGIWLTAIIIGTVGILSHFGILSDLGFMREIAKYDYHM